MPTGYITAPPEAAADLASTLVEERLAACVRPRRLRVDVPLGARSTTTRK